MIRNWTFSIKQNKLGPCLYEADSSQGMQVNKQIKDDLAGDDVMKKLKQGDVVVIEVTVSSDWCD